MHFDFTISLGQVATIATLLGVGWRLDRQMLKYMFEHEMLITEYCEQKGIEITSLPTRVKR